jgi:glycosyltransferase involved in cell wall biosynthesis
VTLSSVHVLYSFPDVIGKPGIGVAAFHQVDGLSRAGVDVTLYCTSLRRNLPDNVEVVETLAIGGRRIPHRALGVERSYRYHDRRVARAIGRHGPALDLVHCWPRATAHTARAARAQGLRTLREVPNTHTADAFEIVARESEALGLPTHKTNSHDFDRKVLALEELEYELADTLLVPSEFSRKTFLARGFAADKLTLHRYGCDTGRFFSGRDADVGERPFTAIFVGRCEPRKGLHHALRAWHDSGASEEGRFVVCGSFEPGYRELLEPLLAHPSVEVHGFVDDPAALMRQSDVLILPSLEEGSALVTYEAQACGCVLLVSDAAGARFRDHVEGLEHPAGDVAALTAQLARVYSDRPFLGRLREASLARVDELSWDAAGADLARIYETQVPARANGADLSLVGG